MRERSESPEETRTERCISAQRPSERAKLDFKSLRSKDFRRSKLLLCDGKPARGRLARAAPHADRPHGAGRTKSSSARVPREHGRCGSLATRVADRARDHGSRGTRGVAAAADEDRRSTRQQPTPSCVGPRGRKKRGDGRASATEPATTQRITRPFERRAPRNRSTCAAPNALQRPVNRGARFSAKAASASKRSLVGSTRS